MKKNYLKEKSLKPKTLTKLVINLFFIFLINNIVVAQGNNCANATAITINGACASGTINDGTATAPALATCPTGNFRYEGWYKFTITTGPTDVTIIGNTTNRNLFLQLIKETGSCTGLTQIYCANSDTNTNSAQTETINAIGLVNGTYYIKVANVGNNNTMNLSSLCVTTPPTITNLLTPSSGCAGSSITITGTYLSGAIAANVTIGGTPVSSITSNDGSTLVAVIGAGTTGTVSVTNSGGTATSIGTFTVNQAPVNPGNPTSDSPQCNPQGVTLTRTGIPPGTENYYWQTASLGTNTTNNNSTYNTTTGGTFYIRSQDSSTGCWSIGQGSLAVVVTPNISTLATVPSPSNGATGVCYAGATPVSSISWTAAAGATSYDVYFGAGSLPGSVTSNVATTTYTTGTLLASTTYYWKIVPRNACGTSSGSPITWTFTTASAPCALVYCVPTGTTSYWITNFTTTGGATNINNSSANSNIYGDYTASSVSQLAGSAINLSISTSSGTHYFYGWVDWNNDGDFVDAGEAIFSTATYTAGYAGSYTIPALQAAGSYRMRIANSWLGAITSCTSGGYSEYEDYTLIVISLTPCTTPTAQPTALNLTVAGTTINGSFTAASPAPSGYLIVRSSSPTAPTVLTNGTTYPVGYTGLGPGTTRVIQGSFSPSNAVTFSDTGLATNTQYYYYIYSYNSYCAGSPYYLATSALGNNATTCINNPTAPVNSAITTSGFNVSWTASAGALNYVVEIYTNAGYTIPVAGSPFTVASPTVTYTATGLMGSTTYYYRIKATTASCSSGYVTGTVTTLLSNDDCSGAISLTVSSTCSYTTYTNTAATASSGVADPSCSFYAGGDVWFSVVVPATGEIDIDTQTGVMTDSGMAIYSGACGSLTLLDCDDDSSSNGLMSYLTRTGLTPGTTIYIRVWGYGNFNNGTFGICVSTPSCPSPSDLYSNILSGTSVTVGWTASPAASGGYQYYINTTGIPPVAGTTPTGSTAAGVISVTLTGLTSGVQYYFWVRSFCGGPDVSGWYGPTNYTPCAVGNGTGTTTLGCTSPIAGGLGLSGADPAALSCSALTCPTLEVSYLPIKQTTTYAVSSIPYSPPYQFTCLQNPVSVNIDDVWSSTINLPFSFCFYGNSYNKCLIGSNGVITFDTTTYAPGGYNAWPIVSNLPNTSIIRNAIFGVYQDIDPSKGGQVGWELITLNTGCRALVASWNEIPMYSSLCNNKYYTGMMVLYENTNIIDVYIQQKQNCGSWNDGNAIVGLQNAAGTAAVVAPARNALDPNWTVPYPGAGEAWRFTPNGPSINPTVQWYQGSVLPANIIAGATGSTYSACPTVTTSYTAEVTYPLCTGNLVVTDNTVVTVNGNKIWNGVTDTNWNVGTNWTPNGVPTNANCVVIPVVGNGRYPSISAAPNAVGYNLAVYSNASLTLGANQNLTITDKITVQAPSTGAFTVNNNANLLQINDAAVNTGSIFYKRIAPNIKGSDYVYWSSPVANQNMATIYDGTFTFASGYKYQWNTTLNNGNGASGNIGQGNWEAASGIMTRARGYIIRGSSSFGMPASSIPTTFNGTPFNGVIPYTVQRGAYTGAPYNGANGVQITNLNDNYNLLGNPYPSSMNALKFLQLNAYDATTNPTGLILGNVKLWTHGTDPLLGVTNPFYGSFLYNYDSNDYLTINYLGTTTPGAPDIIKSGQAFFVQMIDGLTGSGIVNFNNSMRFDTGNLPYSNSGFYKNGNTATSEISLERHRIWLDLVDSNNQSSGILLGYATDATNNYDALFDAPTAVPSSMKLFSMIENETDVYDIQGRTLPFDVNDEIPIGIMAPTQGNYTFAIAAVDGLFDTQNIYLKDNLLNITHDLKVNPYSFTTTSGVSKDRFKIVYIDTALGNPDYSIDNNIKVITNTEAAVSSSNLQMESIVVFNVLGQKLATYRDINTNYFILANLHKNNTTLLLKIKLQTGEVVTRKILF